MYYLYILKCSDNSLYTGITRNLNKRFNDHIAGSGSKYVRSRMPFVHIYTESFMDRSTAQKREYEIKQWSRSKKIRSLKLNI